MERENASAGSAAARRKNRSGRAGKDDDRDAAKCHALWSRPDDGEGDRIRRTSVQRICAEVVIKPHLVIHPPMASLDANSSEPIAEALRLKCTGSPQSDAIPPAQRD